MVQSGNALLAAAACWLKVNGFRVQKDCKKTTSRKGRPVSRIWGPRCDILKWGLNFCGNSKTRITKSYV
jgi:hypothetical protein